MNMNTGMDMAMGIDMDTDMDTDYSRSGKIMTTQKSPVSSTYEWTD